MGCVNSGETKATEDLLNKRTITVATLNYCGIMNSPFEFYCQQFETELKEISSIFLSLIPRYIQNFNKEKFKWEMGKIDLKVRIGRYSPMFKVDAGIENGKFLNKSEFYKKWDEVFQVQVKKAKIQFKPAEKQTTRLYDFIMYHTLLKYVYKTDEVQQALKEDTKKYIKKLKPFHELSFLDQERKVKKMVDNFSKLESDVFFFQEYSEYFYNYLIGRQEHIISVDKTKDTMIIAKQSSFERKKDIDLLLSRLTKEQKDNLGWAEGSAFLCLDNYILISAHLSSKTEKNKPQIQQMKKSLQDFKKVFPEFQIILGGDLNSFLPAFSKDFYMYPDKEEQLTTIKKRTMTQGQFHKANIVVSESKDKIISTLKIESAGIMYISGRVPKKQNYVPTNQHPFDHFVLVAKILKRPRT